MVPQNELANNIIGTIATGSSKMVPQNELANDIIGTIATGSSNRTNQEAALERHCITANPPIHPPPYLISHAVNRKIKEKRLIDQLFRRKRQRNPKPLNWFSNISKSTRRSVNSAASISKRWLQVSVALLADIYSPTDIYR